MKVLVFWQFVGCDFAGDFVTVIFGFVCSGSGSDEKRQDGRFCFEMVSCTLRTCWRLDTFLLEFLEAFMGLCDSVDRNFCTRCVGSLLFCISTFP